MSIPEPEVPGAQQSRLSALDMYRFVCVTIALTSHALLTIKVDIPIDGGWMALALLSKTGAGPLLLLFGLMAEIVSYPRYVREGAVSVRRRLLGRAVACHAAFVGLSTLVAITRPDGVTYAIASIAFLPMTMYSVIFAVYFFLLLALLGVLPLRHRAGFAGLAALLGGVWLIDWAVLSRLPDAPAYFTRVADMIMGGGGRWGPSAFHSLSLVIAGMAVGKLFYSAERRWDAGAAGGAMFVLALSVIGWSVLQSSWTGFATGILNYSYRFSNHPAYFAYSLIAGLIMIGLSYGLRAVLPKSPQQVLLEIGRHTFSYFVIGNALLILTPVSLVHRGGAETIFLVMFLPVVAAVTLLWASRGRELFGGMVGWLTAQARMTIAP